MEVKPGYKQTEVGVIPEEWEVCILSDVSRKITDGDHVTPMRTSQGYYLLSARNVLNGRIDVSDVDYVGFAEYQRMKQRCGPEAGDILISCSGTIGRVTVVPVGFECVLVRSAALAKIDPELADGTFLQFWLQGSKAQWQIASSVNQGAQPNLFLNHIERLLCPQPPFPEQRAIATALIDVDGLLGGLDRLIAKKRDLKQAAMQQLLTGQTRLPGFHGEWEVKTFGEVAFPRRERIDPRRTGVNDFCIELEHIESGSGQIVGSTSTGAQSSLKSVFHPGDVLFGKLRAYLRKYWRATRQGVCSTEIWVLVPRVDAATSEFLFQIVQTDAFIDAASNSYGTHMPRSDWNAVQNHELKMPPRPEQTAIATVLSEMDGELAVLEQRREKTGALKQAMMQELLTGRTRLV
jgi:type I restriction enzyme S subunit